MYCSECVIVPIHFLRISTCGVYQRETEWGRFLYDPLSLCVHILVVNLVCGHTVILSFIFFLDSTDGQIEVSVSAIAAESRWDVWVTLMYVINEEFGSMSRFVLVPEHTVPPETTVSNRYVGFAVYFDRFITLSWLDLRSLSNCRLSIWTCKRQNNCKS